MRKIFGSIFLLICALGILVFFQAFNNLGRAPSPAEKISHQTSENFDADRATFVNVDQATVDRMLTDTFNVRKVARQLLEFSRAENLAPPEKMPETTPDFSDFAQSKQGLKVIWFGHSSFLLNMDGTLILVDPVFGNASPVPMTGKRFQKAIATPSQLPDIDVIVISHDHYDHLEMETVQYYADTTTQFLVPLGVGSHLRHWGVDPTRIIEQDWWQSHSVKNVQFTATPAQHFSGRTGLHGNDTLWASWAIKSDTHNVYFSGDSGYGRHFQEIGNKLGPFDLAFIESGQYNPQWKSIHMLPQEGVQAFKDLGAKRYFPVHWGMFTLSLHAWDDPIRQISQLTLSDDIQLVAPMIGEVVDIDSHYALSNWWEAVSSKALLALSKQ